MHWVRTPISLSSQQKIKLSALVESKLTSEMGKNRAKLILLLGDGKNNKEISKLLKIHYNTVSIWRSRWKNNNMHNKIYDFGSNIGRPRTVLTDKVMVRIEKHLKKKPPQSNTRWTFRSLAPKVGLSTNSLQRALKEMHIKLE